MKNSRGNTTIALLFSVMSGMAFAIVYLDSSRYVAASSAIEQAVRRASRCLSPTDGECMRYESNEDQASLRWLRVDSSGTRNFQIDQRIYEAGLSRVKLGAAISAPLEHLVLPTIEYPMTTVRQESYRAELNRYELISTRVLACAEEGSVLRPAAQHFPSFNEARERLYQDRAPQQWQPYWIDRRGNIRTIGDGFVSQQLSTTANRGTARPGEHVPYAFTVSGSVPAAPDADVTTGPCQGADGADSDVCELPNQSSYSWRRYARIVIKPSARIVDTQAPYGTYVGWSELRFRTSYSDGTQVNRLLGGRDFQRPVYDGSGSAWFNLWVRGPNGAHGGDPDLHHDGLIVERGRSFTISGVISAARADVNVNISLEVLSDELMADQPAPECAWAAGGAHIAQSSLTAAVDGVQTFAQTGLPNPERFVRWADPRPRILPAGITMGCLQIVAPGRAFDQCSMRREPTCDQTQGGFPVSGETPPAACSQTTTSCSGAAPTVSVAGCPAAPTGRIYCNWSEDAASRRNVELYLQSNECPANPRQVRRQPCAPILFGDPAADCPAPADVQQLVQNVAVVNAANQRAGVASLRGRTDTPVPQVHEMTGNGVHPNFPNEFWAVRWQGSTATELCSQQSSRTRCLWRGDVLSDEGAAIYENQSNGFVSLPIASVFSNVRGPDGSRPPETVLNNLQPSIVERTLERIQGTYPFLGRPVPRIAYSQATQHGLDYCPAGYSFPGDLESKLREYAAARRPEAADEQYRFLYEEKLPAPSERTSLLSESAFSQLQQQEQCTPVVVHVEPDLSSERIVDLGIYPRREFPNGPAECAHSRCIAQPAGDVVVSYAPTATVDTGKALERATVEMQRVAPGFQFSQRCSGDAAGCGTFETEVAEGRVRVAAQYLLPLTFPLSAILGRESIVVKAGTEEVLELPGAGASRVEGSS